MQRMTSSHYYITRTPSPPPPNEINHYSVSSNKKIVLSLMLLLSIISMLLALKILLFIPVCLFCSIFTYKLYCDIDVEAFSKAKKMRSKYSIYQINTAFKSPPSPNFDQHVRNKMMELLKEDAFKFSK